MTQETGPRPGGANEPPARPEAQGIPPSRRERVIRTVRNPAVAAPLLVAAVLGGVFGAYKITEAITQPGISRDTAGALPPPATPTPSEAPYVPPTPTPGGKGAEAAVCQSAEQLGPWPPDTNGQFHNIEIDGTQKGAYVEAQLWLPDGPAKTEYWIDMSSRRVTFKNAAGTAFQWNGNCDPKVISAELAAAKARRESEEVNVVKLSLADFMKQYPGRVVLMPGDGTTR